MTDLTNTRAVLLAHVGRHPQLRAEDIFKFLHQSTFGCEHLVTDESGAVARIVAEAAALPLDTTPAPLAHAVEPLCGAYSRVHLAILAHGLSARTLGRLLCLSAAQPKQDVAVLEEHLAVARTLAEEVLLPFTAQDLDAALAPWRAQGYPALHHSADFRKTFRPAYRVIANRYLPYLPLLCEIDRRLARGSLTLAIEGGSASGKSTLGELLAHLYGCTVLHMDDFFLRPDQRTPERLAEIGGNVDRERFAAEVLSPLARREVIVYHPFDCATMTLASPVAVEPTPLTVIEGAYSMHPDLAPAYDMSVFLAISPEHQAARIRHRNTPNMAERFFKEWIPLERRYFEGMRVRERCDMVIEVE